MPDDDPVRRSPPIQVDVTRQGVVSPVGQARVTHIVRTVLASRRVRSAWIAVSFVSRRRIAVLHRRLTGVGGVTDIVTLEHQRSAGAPTVGEIFIAPEVARVNAVDRGISWREETVRLLVHGVLHVLGETHPNADREASRMWKAQERLVRRLMTAERTT